MKSVVISGQEGFLGKNLSHSLVSEAKVTGFKGDIKDIQAFTDFLKNLDKVDYFFHFAGLSSVSECEKNKDEALKINVEAPAQMLEMLSLHHPNATFIFPSTAHVYAPNLNDSKLLSEVSPLRPLNFYAETKLLAEQKLESLSEKLGQRLIILRLFNHSHKSQSPNFFLPSIYQQLLKNKKELRVGNLDLLRDIGAVQDLLRAFKSIILKENLPLYSLYNISSGVGKNLNTLVKLLIRYQNLEVNILNDESLFRSNEPRSIIGDSQKFKQEFQWLPNLSLNEELVIQNFLADL